MATAHGEAALPSSTDMDGHASPPIPYRSKLWQDSHEQSLHVWIVTETLSHQIFRTTGISAHVYVGASKSCKTIPPMECLSYLHFDFHYGPLPVRMVVRGFSH